MNTRIAIGTVVGLVLVGLGWGYALSHKPASSSLPGTGAETDSGNIIGAPENLGTQSASAPASSTQSAGAKTTKPPISVTQKAFATFVRTDMVSTSPRPEIAGIGNVKTVDVVILGSHDVGVVAGRDIMLVDNRWSYTPPVALAQGAYTVQLLWNGGGVQTTLTIK